MSTASFVSNMSAGHSGNLGFPMPNDWAIDQIKPITIGSGRESGQNTFNTPPANSDLDVAFDMTWSDELLRGIQTYFQKIGIPEEGPPESWPWPGRPSTRPVTAWISC